MVNDFVIKYISEKNIEHLLDVLKEQYSITEDWTAKVYIDITVKWDYVARTVDISMPQYVEKALKISQHILPIIPEYAPHAQAAPVYGAKTQYSQESGIS